ncbi:MAG: ABC transporter ATP-binding protein [Spongiibacteraceae bacterium]
MTIALSIQQLGKVYDNGFAALKGIDLEVKQGDFFALLGPNGAGKSTTIGIISSLIQKSSGRVQIFDKSIDDDFSAAKKYLGIVPQEFNFSGFEKVFTILVNQAGYYGLPKALAKQRAEKYLKALGLWEKRSEVGRHLSGGMKRRLMIARALVHEPRLLILDEPTAGVDIEMRRSMWVFLRELNEQGTTIILTTHYLEEAESLCRNIAIIDHGEIVENCSMKNLLSRLHQEALVLDVKNSLLEAPQIEGFELKLVDEHSLEVVVVRGQTINQLFAGLNKVGVEVVSMRNKSNRLEELFVNLINSGAA